LITLDLSISFFSFIPVIMTYFFDGDGDHRDLHSFPTRRSSDLSGVVWYGIRWTYFVPEKGGYSALPPNSWRLVLTQASSPEGLRSEEHTSELQSRFDLVCRLLLEKKKRRSPPGASWGSGGWRAR